MEGGFEDVKTKRDIFKVGAERSTLTKKNSNFFLPLVCLLFFPSFSLSSRTSMPCMAARRLSGSAAATTARGSGCSVVRRAAATTRASPSALRCGVRGRQRLRGPFVIFPLSVVLLLRSVSLPLPRESLERGFFRRPRRIIREKEKSLASFLEREREREREERGITSQRTNLRRSYARQLDPCSNRNRNPFHPACECQFDCFRECRSYRSCRARSLFRPVGAGRE